MPYRCPNPLEEEANVFVFDSLALHFKTSFAAENFEYIDGIPQPPQLPFNLPALVLGNFQPKKAVKKVKIEEEDTFDKMFKLKQDTLTPNHKET